MWLCFMTPVNVHVLNGFTMAELSKPILFDNMKPLKDVFSSFLSLSQYKMWQNMDLTFLHTTIWLRHSIKIQTRFVFYVKNYEDRKDKLSVFLYIKCLILKVVWWLNIAVSTHFQETISVCDIAMYKLIFLQKKNRNRKIASNRNK